MKLYRIIVLHAAPKDSHTSTETYLAAESEERVADWISENKVYGCWFDKDTDEDEPEDEIDPDDVPEPSFKEYVMQHRGDLEDENGWEDAYYGVTKWGWSEVAGATLADIERLVQLGIAEVDAVAVP